jgi:LysM domain-containing protein
MTERGLPIVDGAPACPFVAFEDDRDERATSPDHRHRCYAEARPAPRALAHQEAYCLSSAFPVCPTFQDWARREAAHSRADGPRASDDDAAASQQPQRNPPRDWSAPPPWAAGAAAGAAGEAWHDEGESVEDVPRRGRGLSGSYADRVASGTSEAGGDPGAGDGAGDDDFDADHEDAPAAAGIAGAGLAGPGLAGAGLAGAGMAGSAATHVPERMPERPMESRGATPPPRHERRRDPDAPEWERAKPSEVYPTLRARTLPQLSVPPLLVAVVAIALAAAVLFALPGLLGFGSPSAVSSPSPSPRSSTAAETFAPTPVPQPTQQLYVVQSGDTMSKIAKRFHLALADLIAANAENIPNPDKLQIGDQVIIPVPQPSELPAASPAAS